MYLRVSYKLDPRGVGKLTTRDQSRNRLFKKLEEVNDEQAERCST